MFTFKNVKCIKSCIVNGIESVDSNADELLLLSKCEPKNSVDSLEWTPSGGKHTKKKYVLTTRTHHTCVYVEVCI